ncbi:MAG: Rrf2 family transcriptional regulator [candidate division Zixibacteria bacterium]|nr:Rrf2 family transcriptional regulator [candidate division Zixibacteria bacterium]
MKLSRKSDYALRAVWHLAKLPTGSLASINAIAEGEVVPREFLAKILKDLTRAEILVSFQGVRGGYRLARTPREITFLDVIEAIDGPIHLNLCTEENCSCERYNICEFRSFWEAQEVTFKKALGKQHFAKYRNRSKK